MSTRGFLTKLHVTLAAILILGLFAVQPAFAQSGCRAFSVTGKAVCGKFLTYWNDHGGLSQQGYPISAEMQEVSEVDGKTYTVQYFERAVFESHPENRAPHDVLLMLLGALQYRQKYATGAPNQTPNNATGSVLFSETGKRVGGTFLAYWRQNGGLPQYGYPISDEFTETSDLDGNQYKVQYFERAVFELHPENRPPYNVLLSQLGTTRYKAKYGSANNSLDARVMASTAYINLMPMVPPNGPPIQLTIVVEVTGGGELTPLNTSGTLSLVRVSGEQVGKVDLVLLPEGNPAELQVPPPAQGKRQLVFIGNATHLNNVLKDGDVIKGGIELKLGSSTATLQLPETKLEAVY
jgi:hypothetical protein